MRIEVDMQKRGVELHNAAAVAALDNMDLPLGADSSVDNRVRQQLNSQRVLENLGSWHKAVVEDTHDHRATERAVESVQAADIVVTANIVGLRMDEA